MFDLRPSTLYIEAGLDGRRAITVQTVTRRANDHEDAK